jgi:hypothetical protein
MKAPPWAANMMSNCSKSSKSVWDESIFHKDNERGPYYRTAEGDAYRA